MRILFLDEYFKPESIAFTHLEDDLIQALVLKGHEILVICPTPTRGISDDVRAKYRKIKDEELYDGKVKIKRFYAPRERRNVILRAFRYLWCNLREYQIGKRCKSIDSIFAVSTPPTQGLLAGKLAAKLKCPFVYSLQDVFPDSLVTTGITREGSMIWNIGKKIEKKTYEKSSKIIVISKSIEKNLINKGVPANKIVMIPNWVDTEKVKPVKKFNNKLYAQYEISPSKFTIVYAGNFGASQGAEIVIKAAEMLIHYDDIQFAIFGGGLNYESCRRKVIEKKLKNVHINPLLPQERVPEVYSLGDVALITCKKGVGHNSMPSKLWTIMACDVPIIAAFDVDSELVKIVHNANAGIGIEPENPEKLTQAILDMYGEEHNEEAYNGRTYVKKNASKESSIENYLALLV